MEGGRKGPRGEKLEEEEKQEKSHWHVRLKEEKEESLRSLFHIEFCKRM